MYRSFRVVSSADGQYGFLLCSHLKESRVSLSQRVRSAQNGSPAETSAFTDINEPWAERRGGDVGHIGVYI